MDEQRALKIKRNYTFDAWKTNSDFVYKPFQYHSVTDGDFEMSRDFLYPETDFEFAD